MDPKTKKAVLTTVAVIGLTAGATVFANKAHAETIIKSANEQASKQADYVAVDKIRHKLDKVRKKIKVNRNEYLQNREVLGSEEKILKAKLWEELDPIMQERKADIERTQASAKEEEQKSKTDSLKFIAIMGIAGLIGAFSTLGKSTIKALVPKRKYGHLLEDASGLTFISSVMMGGISGTLAAAVCGDVLLGAAAGGGVAAAIGAFGVGCFIRDYFKIKLLKKENRGRKKIKKK